MESKILILLIGKKTEQTDSNQSLVHLVKRALVKVVSDDAKFIMRAWAKNEIS